MRGKKEAGRDRGNDFCEKEEEKEGVVGFEGERQKGRGEAWGRREQMREKREGERQWIL